MIYIVSAYIVEMTTDIAITYMLNHNYNSTNRCILQWYHRYMDITAYN